MVRRYLLPLLLPFAALVGCAAIITPICIVTMLALGITSSIGKAIGAALANVTIQLGPECDGWPVQATDAKTAAVLEAGRQTALQRTSLDVEATGGFIDEFFHGQGVRVRLRWRKPNLYRIDVTGEAADTEGRIATFKRVYLKSAEDVFSVYDFDAKRIDVLEGKNAKEALEAFSVLRWEPLPWFFPTVHDVTPRRWKIEHLGPEDRGVHLKLRPANERWTMEGDVWLDPQSGMPNKITLNGSLLGAKGDVNVERRAENAAVPDEIFEPWTPDPDDGWQIHRHDLDKKEDAEEAVRILAPKDKDLVAAKPGNAR